MTNDETNDIHVTIVNVMNSISSLKILFNLLQERNTISRKEYILLMKFLDFDDELNEIAIKLATKMRIASR